MPVFFITSSDIQEDYIQVKDMLFSHLRKSRRVHIGEELWFGNESRQRYRATITHLTSNSLQAKILQRLTGPSPPSPALCLAQAVLKGDRMNWVVQKATELGITTLIPLLSDRVVIRPEPHKMSAYQERWQRIAQDAAQQSEQWSIPRVTSLMNLSQMANEYGACQAKYILTERNSAPGLFNTQISTSTMKQILLMIGPEGGWTEEELNKTEDLGFLPLSLGKSILRAETATVAALSLIQGKLGNLG